MDRVHVPTHSGQQGHLSLLILAVDPSGTTAWATIQHSYLWLYCLLETSCAEICSLLFLSFSVSPFFDYQIMLLLHP